MRTQLKADLALILIALFWGFANVLTKIGLDDLAVFNLIAIRFSLSFAVFVIVFWQRIKRADRQTVVYSATLATILFLVYCFATFGLSLTSVSNASFLMCLASLFIPFLAFVFQKKKPETKVLLSIGLAILGVGLISVTSFSALNLGDLLCLGCSLAFAIHIMVTEKYTKQVDPVALSVIQLGFVSLYALAATFLFESPTLPTTTFSWLILIVLSILCTALAFIIQTVAQKYTTSMHTGLILTLEPLFGAAFAFIILNEVLPPKSYLGDALLIVSILLVEIDLPWPKKAFKEVE